MRYEGFRGMPNFERSLMEFQPPRKFHRLRSTRIKQTAHKSETEPPAAMV